jgi:hypothetical protein
LEDVDVKLTVSGKRLVERVKLNKPILPLFAAFLSSNAPPPVALLVAQCMESVREREEVIKSPVKYLADLLDANSEVLLEERFQILNIWMENQANMRRAYSDLAPRVLVLIPRLSVSGARATIKGFVLCDGNLEDLVKELPKRELQSRPILKTILESQVDPVLFLSAFSENAKELLTNAEFRKSLVYLFEALLTKVSNNISGIVKVMLDANISSTQSDDTWNLTAKILMDLVATHVTQPKLLTIILHVDMALVLPSLPAILSEIGESEDWKTFFMELSKAMANSRQLDVLISKMVQNSSSLIPVDFFTDTRQLLTELHKRTVEVIIEGLMAVLMGNPASEGSLVVSLRWLTVFTMTHPDLVGKYYIDLARACGELSSILARKDAINLVCLLIDRVEKDFDFSPFVTLSEKCPEMTSLQVALALKLNEDLPKDLSVLTHSEIQRYLPGLLIRGVEFSSFRLSEWILTSAVFWESLSTLDTLLITDNVQDLLQILEHMPKGILPSANATLLCLEKLLRAQRLDHPCVYKLLMTTNDLRLEPSIVQDLLNIGDSQTLLALYRNNHVSQSTIIDFACTSLDAMVKALNILEELFAKATIELSDQKELAETFIKFAKEARLDTAIFYRLFALMTAFGGDVVVSALFDGMLANDDSKLAAAAALHERGLGDLANVNLGEAVDQFLNSQKLSRNDLSRFIRGTSIEKVQTVINSLSGINPGDSRMLQLLDTFMIQSVEIQTAICPIVDQLIVLSSCQKIASENTTTWMRLLSHRVVCGGINIGEFQADKVFDRVLDLLVELLDYHSDDVCALITTLFQYHWVPLMRRRPLLLGILLKLMRVGPPRKVGRLLTDFASHRQSSQHYYVLPLLLAYARNPDLALRPAMCMLIRHVDQQAAIVQKEKVKYFKADPFERLMCLAPTDDAKLVLKSLVTLYNSEYKYTGKA